MTTVEKCSCGRRTMDFRSDFDGDVVSKIYCPDCVDRAPGDALIFEMCNAGPYEGTWGVRYNAGELKRLDSHFRPGEDYFLSLLISGVCGPMAVTAYKKGSLCRIKGFKHGPDAAAAEMSLGGREHDAAHQEKPAKRPPDVIARKTKSPRRRAKGKK